MLISFEGGEGAGKTSLIKMTAGYLELAKVKVLETREPGGTLLGNEVRSLVLKVAPEMKICAKAELMLYLASRAQIVTEIIQPALAAGKFVLCDRFNDSTVVYQGVARGLGAQAVRSICDFICGPIQPDVTFYLDVDPEIGLLRTKKTAKEHSKEGEVDRMEAEDLSFHRKVREGYLEIARQDPSRVIVIDASKTLDLVWEDVLKALNPCLNN